MGSVNLDNTGSGSAITLSSDGTNLLLNGTAIGGGGGGGDPDLYRDNASGATTPSATGTNAVAIGSSSVANSSAAIALGDSALAYSSDTLVLQKGRASGTQATSIAVHNNSSLYGSNHLGAVSIGSHAKSTQDYSFALGWYSQANANYAMAFGRGANAGHISSVAIGHNAATTSANQIALGSTSDTVKISGTYTLPTADGSANQVLTTDGSGAVTFADAGGGGADLYAANPSSATNPTANALNSVAIGDGMTTGSSAVGGIAIGQDGTVSGTNSISLGKSGAYGTGSFAAAISSVSYQTYGADGDYSISVGYRSRASSSGAIAIGYEAKSLNNYSTAISRSYASGADSFAAAIASNSSSYGATGANSVAFSYLAKASGNYAFAHGYEAQATGNSTIAMGFQAQASNGVAFGYKGRATGLRSFGVNNNTSGGATANYATAIGDGCLASGTSSVAIGSGCTADALGAVAIGRTTNVNGIRKFVYSATTVSGNYDGSSQTGIQVLSAATTDATATALAAHGTASTDNQVILPNNSAYAFHGTIVARQQAADGTACAAWKVDGLIRREGSAGTTVLVNSATTVLDNTPNWGMALSADTTNGGLKIEATGAASTDIRWVATIHTSEVTYA